MKLSRAEMRRADRAGTTFLLRRTTRRRRKIVPDASDLIVKPQGFFTFMRGNLALRLLSISEVAARALLSRRVAEGERFQAWIALGGAREWHEAVVVVREVEPGPRAGQWTVELEFACAPEALRRCVRSLAGEKAIGA